MQAWKIALAVALPAAVVITLILYIACCRHSPKKSNPEVLEEGRGNRFAAFRTLRGPSLNPTNKVESVWRTNCTYSNHYPLKAFRWSDHPSLIQEVVEHGWITFGFTKTCAAANFWDLYSSYSNKGGVEAEISWEMESGADYLQKIRLNPGLPTRKNTNSLPPVQSVQGALPLPGPSLGGLSFPQEAYFEITILADNGEQVKRLCAAKSFAEDEAAKLISQSLSSEEHLMDISSEMTTTNFKGDGLAKKNPRSSSNHLQQSSMDPTGCPKVISLGLAVGGTALYRLPGCEPGSVGFHSTGFLFLNGMVHLEGDQEQHKSPPAKRVWGDVNTVIGCGFDPSNRKVFYTLNGEQVYSLTCNSDEFIHPLYPTIAANYDVTVLVNFGQSHFWYLPANDQRVANPCLKWPLPSSHVMFPSGSIYEDSGDLFSMGRIDSQWLGNLERSNSEDLQHRHVHSETDSELFEIPLDDSNR